MQKGYKKFTILINEPFCLEMSKVYLLDPWIRLERVYLDSHWTPTTAIQSQASQTFKIKRWISI